MNADALSRSPCRPSPAIGIAEDEIQVSTLTTVPGKDTQSIAGSASTASTCAQQDSTISLKEWPTHELKTHDESSMADVGTDTVSVAEQPTRQMSASVMVSSHLPEAPSVDAQDRKQQAGEGVPYLERVIPV